MATNASGIRAGRAFVELGVSDRLSEGLRAAQRRLSAFGAGLRSIGAGLLASGAAAAAPFALATRTFTTAGDAIEKMSRRTGVAAEALSELIFAAEQSGSSAEELEQGFRAMARGLFAAERGGGEAKQALDALGLSVADLKGLAPEAQFALLADRIATVEDPVRRAALAMRLFGDSGTKLLPLLEGGARGIAALRAEAAALGLTISADTARSAASLADAFNRGRKVLRITAITIGSALAPSIERMTDATTRLVRGVNEWIGANKPLVVTLAQVVAAVVALGGGLLAAGVAVQAVAFAFGGLATAVSVAGAALGGLLTVLGFIASPLGLLVAGLTAAGGAFLYFSGLGGRAIAFLRERFGELAAFTSRVFGGLRDALAAGDIGLAAEILWNTLRVVWLQGTLALRQTWAKALNQMRQLFNSFATAVTATAFDLFSGFADLVGADLLAALSQSASKITSAAGAAKANELDAGLDETLRRQIDDLNRARQDLERALDEARRARSESGALAGGAAGGAPDLAGLGDAVAARGAAARGTFNAQALQSLQTNDPKRDRELRAQERTAEILAELLAFLKRRPPMVYA